MLHSREQTCAQSCSITGVAPRLNSSPRSLICYRISGELFDINDGRSHLLELLHSFVNSCSYPIFPSPLPFRRHTSLEVGQLVQDELKVQVLLIEQVLELLHGRQGRLHLWQQGVKVIDEGPYKLQHLHQVGLVLTVLGDQCNHFIVLVLCLDGLIRLDAGADPKPYEENPAHA